MVKLVVLYGRPEDPDAFERYYADTHTALAKAIPGLRRFEAARGVPTPDGAEVPYQRIAELTFDDLAPVHAGRRAAQGPAPANDIPPSPRVGSPSSSPRSTTRGRFALNRRGPGRTGLRVEVCLYARGRSEYRMPLPLGSSCVPSISNASLTHCSKKPRS